ncbi:MAG: acyl-CoA desaturase [Bacteroidetes bacterium]|nr:MAG: acyl-CoA desaturase [Bacteroidota bacterium]
MVIPKFPAGKPSFHVVLKNRVNQYFEETGKNLTGDSKIIVKALILIAAMVALYVHVVFFTPVWYLAVVECALLGLTIASIGFNVMHDGSHGSFSKYPWMNWVAAITLNILGGNAFMWNMKHCVIHHAYTNVHDIDDDLNAGVLLRLSEHQKRYKVHSFQHYYVWFLYMQLYVFWIFVSDYKKYFRKRIGDIPLKKMTTLDHVIFWKGKLINLALYVVLPIIFTGWLNWLVGFLIVTQLGGLVLSIVFQLAHTVEPMSFPLANSVSGKMEDEWAVHQLKTTANFATRNKLISWLVGGLNFQVEHHLFPKVSHVHYPAINRIVKQACAEYGIPYYEFPKMRHAVVSHISHLRKLGQV